MNNNILKIGDIIYILDKSPNGNAKILKAEVQNIWDDGNVDAYIIDDNSAEFTFHQSLLYKAVFHTREEAEKHLKI